MKPDNNIMPEDLDQWEYDYYARKSSGGWFGCLFFTAIIIISIIASIIISLS